MVDSFPIVRVTRPDGEVDSYTASDLRWEFRTNGGLRVWSEQQFIDAVYLQAEWTAYEESWPITEVKMVNESPIESLRKMGPFHSPER